MKRVLFVGADVADYLSIGVLNGLKSMPNIEVYDYPKSEIIYELYKEQLAKDIRGGGFTLFFQQQEEPISRFHLLFDKLRGGYFDLVVIGSIDSNFGYYVQLLPWLKVENTVILDGADSPNLYPYSGYFWRRPYYWFLPRAHNKYLYFKREWIPKETYSSRYYKLIPKWICDYLPPPKKLRKISFSIPEEKIIKELPVKTRLFPKHIVDPEIAGVVPDSSGESIFNSEDEYYADLRASRFGITTKRSGWDCLRHYEIAANGAVICFRQLNKKPVECAPHQLVDGVNCISYNNYADLVNKINNLSDDTYRIMQQNTLAWVKANSCMNAAKNLLDQVFPQSN